MGTQLSGTVLAVSGDIVLLDVENLSLFFIAWVAGQLLDLLHFVGYDVLVVFGQSCLLVLPLQLQILQLIGSISVRQVALLQLLYPQLILLNLVLVSHLELYIDLLLLHERIVDNFDLLLQFLHPLLGILQLSLYIPPFLS